MYKTTVNEMNNEMNEENHSMSNLNFQGNNEIQGRNVELSPFKNQVANYSNEYKLENDQSYNCTPRKMHKPNQNEINTLIPTNTQTLSTGPGPYPYEQNIFTPFSEDKNSINVNQFHAFQSPYDGSCCLIASIQENSQSLFKSPPHEKFQDMLYNQQSPDLFSSKKVENGKILNFKECIEKQQIELEEKHKCDVSNFPHIRKKAKAEQFLIPHSIAKPKNSNQNRSNEEKK